MKKPDRCERHADDRVQVVKLGPKTRLSECKRVVHRDSAAAFLIAVLGYSLLSGLGRPSLLSKAGRGLKESDTTDGKGGGGRGAAE